MLRDTMVVGVGCSREFLLSLRAEQYDTLQSWASRLGLPTLVNALQILEQCLSRMRWSVHRRALLEVALVQLAHLQSLTDLAQLAAELGASATGHRTTMAANPSPAATKKKAPGNGHAASGATADASGGVSADPSGSVAFQTSPPQAANLAPTSRLTLTADTADEIWRQTIGVLAGTTANAAANYRQVEFQPPDRLVVSFAAEFHRQRCDRPEVRQSLENALHKIVRGRIQLALQVDAVQEPRQLAARPTQRQLQDECFQNPLVQEVIDLFDAEITQVVTQQSP